MAGRGVGVGDPREGVVGQGGSLGTEGPQGDGEAVSRSGSVCRPWIDEVKWREKSIAGLDARRLVFRFIIPIFTSGALFFCFSY